MKRLKVMKLPISPNGKLTLTGVRHQCQGTHMQSSQLLYWQYSLPFDTISSWESNFQQTGLWKWCVKERSIMKKFRYGFLLSAIIGCLLMSASALAASKVWVPTVSTDYSIFDEGATLKTESRVFSFNNSGWVTKTGNRKYTWKNSTLKKITDLNTGRTTSF